jgi:hypothetical protein
MGKLHKNKEVSLPITIKNNITMETTLLEITTLGYSIFVGLGFLAAGVVVLAIKKL